ncbi:MAG: response regulator [Oscillibacter sp.]|nr:response regulator [Oscillibacter sp.]
MRHKNKTSRFLATSLVLVLIVSIAIFSFLAVFLNRQSASTIREVSQMYMSDMSEQIAMHFQTVISLRLGQLDALVETAPVDKIHTDAAQRSELIRNAHARDFTSLGFYHTDGSFDMLYGGAPEVENSAPFLASLSNGEQKVAVANAPDGERLILLGVPATHTPTEEHPCAGLIATLPATYITETLALSENEEHVYSFIIREDKSFVIRTSGDFRNSYFDRVNNLYSTIDGQTPETYMRELAAAMANNEDYSSKICVDGEPRQMYCTKLPHSEWYLLTFMPYTTLDRMVSGFTTRWTVMVFAACLLALAVLLAVFARYFQMSRQQMAELEKARWDAEQASRAKSEFLSNMSHDIRTPMNAIVGMTAIATASIDDKEQIQNCLKKITLSGRHLLGLINDVLDMSKIESGKMTLTIDQVSLREVMDSIVSIVQPQVRAKRQKFDVFIHDISTENVRCDSVRLNQVLLNILGNAVKFTPDEGEIHVAMYEEPSEKGDGYVRIHFDIRDNGIGMTPEFKEKIFEAFVREDNMRVHKTEGSGLGMAITKFIVDAMGGDITVNSTPGQGSEFHVTLDLEKAEVMEADMVLPDWNMLVVDDDRQLCESTISSLKSIGIHADWTLDAESALEMVEARHGQHNAYQIILLDWKLPGIDGITAARTIRERYGDEIPILLISAYDWSEIETEAKAAGVTGFISKPLFKSTLFYGLRPFLGDAEDMEEAEAEAKSKEPEQDLTGRRILLAEDNELNWEIAFDLLSELGPELEWAENGQICVDKFRNSAPGHYDAILMDLRMPVMTGYEATRAIRGMDRPDAAEIPIIAMTADAFAEDVKKCLDAGMNAHVSKPINVREVCRQLLKYMSPL